MLVGGMVAFNARGQTVSVQVEALTAYGSEDTLPTIEEVSGLLKKPVDEEFTLSEYLGAPAGWRLASPACTGIRVCSFASSQRRRRKGGTSAKTCSTQPRMAKIEIVTSMFTLVEVIRQRQSSTLSR